MMSKAALEMTIDTDSFNAIAELAYRESGLQLAAEKTSMIQSRLRHRLRALGLQDFANYSAFVCSDDGRDERRHMISALTTNVSHFFREKHHFDVLKKQFETVLLPKLKAGGRVRIWSAGCSNGQEALSIAMVLLEVAPDVAKLDLRILATDIDPEVVNFAKQSSYHERLVGGIPTELLHKYFQCVKQNDEKIYQAGGQLLKLISFRELNLLAKWPMQQKMDVIFCRNVVIYFNVDTQSRLWPRFRNILSPNGILFLGHSERISDPATFGFLSDGPTTYLPSPVSDSVRF
ncbi:CheR family methyltransferase [uncultured Roseobacter sp.]|uniref:CheR family methyltransferase n=1 Tax=uncultured Roseobacter sp. TaxID=114847 RepID=UPI00260F5360|nr:CheR family methyltransferase [uncultured Roseobacter sp.]